MKIPLIYCPPITKVEDFFKVKLVVYINLYKAPEEVSPTGLKLIKIYGTPGEMYRHFKKGYMTPVFEETGYQLLILWNQPLQAILDSFRVFDFSEFDREKDGIVLTKRQIEALYSAAQNHNCEDRNRPSPSEN